MTLDDLSLLMTSPLLALGGKGEAEPVGYSQHASAHHGALTSPPR